MEAEDQAQVWGGGGGGGTWEWALIQLGHLVTPVALTVWQAQVRRVRGWPSGPSCPFSMCCHGNFYVSPNMQ